MKSHHSPLHAQLLQLHSDLLDLHKALIEHERGRFEKARRKIAHPGDFLQLLLEDPFFAWLRALSGLIVQIDEYVESKTPVTADDGTALLNEARLLLSPTGGETSGEEGGKSGEFRKEFARARGESKEVAEVLERYLGRQRGG